MSSVTSPSSSKIPVAVGRQQLGSPSVADQSSSNSSMLVSRTTKLSTSSSANIQKYRTNGCDQAQATPPGRKGSIPIIRSSRIPTSKSKVALDGFCEDGRAISPSEDTVVRRKSSPKRSNADRPQSIDIEDEFNHQITRQRQQARQGSEPNARKRSTPTNHHQSGSPSRIPVATDHSILGSNGTLRKSTSKSSLGSGAPSPNRKFSAPQLCSFSAAATPTSSRANSPAKSLGQSRNGGSQERLLRTSNGNINSSSFGDFNTKPNLEPGSKIPLPKVRQGSSPPKSPPKPFPKSTLPTVAWSLKTERQERRLESPSSTSNSKAALQHGDEGIGSSRGGKVAKQSFNLENQAVYNFNDKENWQERNDEEEEGGGGGKKKLFEAYVMTGDRMISLAKTPANNEFRSKFYKPNLKQIPLLNDNKDDGWLDFNSSDAAVAKSEGSPNCGSVHSLIDTSATRSPASSEAGSSSTSSVHHVESDSAVAAAAVADRNASSSEAISSCGSDAKQPPVHHGDNGVSPDVSTSSLISASEHYDGASLPDNISPETSSSPETPEWSLLDSYYKKNLSSSSRVDPENGNRTVISIGKSEAQSESSASNSPGNEAAGSDVERGASFVASFPAVRNHHQPSPTFSTPTTSRTFSPPFSPSSPIELAPSASPHHSSSEDESDLDSLPSYNPPPKVIDVPSAERLAKRLFMLDGFRKTDVSRHLSRNNDFNRVVAEEYLKFFHFSNDSLNAALKKFLDKFCLTGETQERERVLLHFSKRYLECNPSVAAGPDALYRSQDSVHTLTCAIMLLNTDLHGDNHLQRKMTCGEFVENLSELNDGFDFPRDLLKNIYHSVKEEAIPWSNESDALPPACDVAAAAVSLPPTVSSVSIPTAAGVEPSQPATWRQAAAAAAPVSTKSISVGNAGGGINPFLSVPDSRGAIDYKKGYVMRKCCHEPNGKRTKLGKRGWRMYFLSLRDMVLYCFKDEKSLRQPGAFEDLSCAIRVHHGLAEVASDYTKKQHVFRLHTSDRAQYLFQTSDEKELVTWIDAVNYAVALLSTPQLPPPCSSDVGRFQRPLMPSSKCTLSIADQLTRHEMQLMQLRCQIESHLQSPPQKNAKAGVVQVHKDKKEFLRFEITRYETYVLTLRRRGGAVERGIARHHQERAY